MYSQGVDGKFDFTKKDIEDGKLAEFVSFLIGMRCEMRLWTDGMCYVVEYLQDFRKDDGTEFVVNDDMNPTEEKGEKND